MKLKRCSKCKEFKSLENFYKDIHTKDKLYCRCKQCCLQKSFGKIEEEELFKKNKKRCSKCNLIKKLSEFHKDICSKFGYNYQCIQCKKEYILENKRQRKNYRKKYYDENVKKASDYNKNYYLENIEKILQKNKNWFKQNKEHWRNYLRNRSKTDLSFRLKNNLRTRIQSALKGHNKSLSTMLLLGCEVDYLMYHLQEQFTEGMSWDNYGDWHVDHIKPCALFDMSEPEEQRKCFSYLNLQPLWAEDNFKKSDKYYA